MVRYLILSWLDPTTGATVSVHFDVVSSHSYEAAMSITEHPVEKGAPIVDHARPEPLKYSLEAFVSNTPLPSNIVDEAFMAFAPIELDYSGANQNPRGVALLTPGGLTQAVTSLVSSGPVLPKQATVFRSTGEMPDRARSVFEKLEAARVGRSLVTLSTHWKDIDNMLIGRVAVSRNGPEGYGGLAFQIDLTQVRIVASQFASYPKPAQKRAAPEVKKGAQVIESTAHKLLDATGVLNP